ncbi:MAG: translocation/assembly module TamB domain-containing protein, partial [Prochlorococcus sp.]
SLFTTTFHLDRRAPNVAVFTPSMGLIPYVDIAMKTEVSDSVSLGTGTNTVSSNIFDTNGTGALGAAGQLRLVKVVVTVAGPADRFAQHLKLRSYPPMPKAQLMALIGGNSLAGLSNSDAGAAIATALGQSLLSPMLGTFSDAFSERMEIALYPTYVSPVIDDRKERVSGRVPPQLALVTDFGMAITDTFDFSVLAAPNRNDIPAQGTLTYDISPNLSLSGSVDTQGTWQSQMQLFFRF